MHALLIQVLNIIRRLENDIIQRLVTTYIKTDKNMKRTFFKLLLWLTRLTIKKPSEMNDGSKGFYILYDTKERVKLISGIYSHVAIKEMNESTYKLGGSKIWFNKQDFKNHKKDEN